MRRFFPLLVISTLLTACAPLRQLASESVRATGGTYSMSNTGLIPEPLPGNPSHAAGSGCTVGGTQLFDGVWFGFVTAIEPPTVTVDVACYWSGDAAATAALADGAEPIDEYVRNDDPTGYRIGLNPRGVAFYWPDGVVDSEPYTAPLEEWPIMGSAFREDCPASDCGVWLFVNGGTVTELTEWFTPPR